MVKSKFSDGIQRYIGSQMDGFSPLLRTWDVSTVPLTMLRGDLELAKGTGFFWRHPEGYLLVTAWHNLSGLHHFKRTPLHSMGAVPDSVRVRFMSLNPKKLQEQVFPLYLDSDCEEPRWFVDGQVGNYFDLAALPFNFTGDCELACVNDYASPLPENVWPGDDIFVVGCPAGISVLEFFAVWKRGSVAMSPQLFFEGQPKFLVDVVGRSGMSGGPAFIKHPFSASISFLGLYSGRASGADLESSELGIVWRAELVEALVSKPALDEKPEPGKGVTTMVPFVRPEAL